MSAGSHVQQGADHGSGPDRRTFLESHRALAVRTREFERLTDGIARGLLACRSADAEEQDDAVVRRSPDRCVVQLGPVALTVAWLRSTLNSVADGELLVIVWRGVIAAGGSYVPDSTTAHRTPVRSATAVWEEVLAAAGVDEASWLWRPAGADIGGYSSAELAERCVAHLRETYASHEDVVPPPTAGLRRPAGSPA